MGCYTRSVTRAQPRTRTPSADVTESLLDAALALLEEGGSEAITVPSGDRGIADDVVFGLADWTAFMTDSTSVPSHPAMSSPADTSNTTGSPFKV